MILSSAEFAIQISSLYVGLLGWHISNVVSGASEKLIFEEWLHSKIELSEMCV